MRTKCSEISTPAPYRTDKSQRIIERKQDRLCMESTKARQIGSERTGRDLYQWGGSESALRLTISLTS